MNKTFLDGRKDLTEPIKGKEYYIITKVEFANLITAESEEDAKRIIKEMFIDEYNIILQDQEIESIEEA